jgi:excisionase family DNA binding protein
MTAADWLNVLEVADRLRSNPRTIYEGVRAGTVPHRRVGRAVRVPASWVDANAVALADGQAAALDVDELADAVADRLLVRLAQLLARAAAPGGEPGAVLDLTRDDRPGRHDGTPPM